MSDESIGYVAGLRHTGKAQEPKRALDQQEPCPTIFCMVLPPMAQSNCVETKLLNTTTVTSALGEKEMRYSVLWSKSEEEET